MKETNEIKEENNIDILDELNKGCCMGSDAVKFILDKIEGKKFKEVCENLLEEYEDLEEKINKYEEATKAAILKEDNEKA